MNERMSNGLSPQSEQYLAQVVASGMFPSKEAALDAAVVALREKNENEEVPLIPEEHMALVEEALASLEAGEGRPITEEDWQRWHALARKVPPRIVVRDNARGNPIPSGKAGDASVVEPADLPLGWCAERFDPTQPWVRARKSGQPDDESTLV
jgi:hypothetical protein